MESWQETIPSIYNNNNCYPSNIDGNDRNFIDYDILEIISEFDAKAADRNIGVHLSGIEKVNVTAIH